MLCVAHKALTCKSCFGSNFENAPEQKIEDFRRVNRELPQFKEEFSKEIEERKAFLENQFSFQRRYNNYQQEKRIEEERNKPVQPVEKPIQPEPVKKQNSTEFGNSNSYEEMIRRMEEQEKLKREAQARNEQEKEKKQKSRKTNSYRP